MLDLRSLHKFSASGGFVPPHVNNAVLWPDVARLCGSLPSWEVPSSVLWWRRFLRWSILHQLALSRPCWKLSQRFRYSSSNYLSHAMALYCLGSFVTRKGHLMDTLFGVTNAVFQRGRKFTRSSLNDFALAVEWWSQRSSLKRPHISAGWTWLNTSCHFRPILDAELFQHLTNDLYPKSYRLGPC